MDKLIVTIWYVYRFVYY